MEDSQPSSAHWCHQCSAPTTAERAVGGSHGDLICADCGGGFVEAMESAQALIHVRRAVRRHERSQQRRFRAQSAVMRRLEPTISEADLSSPAYRQEVHRLVHLVELLPLHLRSSGSRHATPNDVTEETHDADVTSSNNARSDQVAGIEGMASYNRMMPNELDSRSELGTLGGLRPLGFEGNEFFSLVNDSYTGSRHVDSGLDGSAHANLFNSTSGREESGENGELREDEGEVRSVHLHDNNDDDGEVSDSDVDVRVFQFSDWDSFDEDNEDEWEEGEADDDGIHERDDLPDEVSVGHGNEGSQASSPLEGNARIIPRDILRRLRAISRNIGNFNAEMYLENLNLDTYVSNPGDYVDARGFEELLQQFMDSDNTRRGPPPAAKSAIEGLPTVLVRQVDMENGSALCAICKDLVEFNQPAKQLPCLHLYHSECILPWLTVRNSCPMCRYELLTDDPDYEEQRKYENMQHMIRQHERGNSDSSSTLHEAEVEELGREANQNAEANVLLLDTSKREVADDSEARVCPRVLGSGNGHSRERGSILDVIAGPLFSVVGLVVVSCLGNLLLGSSSQRGLVNNQVGRASKRPSGRSWWTKFFG